jgi:hypothetical protein
LATSLADLLGSLVGGVLMVTEECRMKLRGANPGQEVPPGINECISYRAAHWHYSAWMGYLDKC